MTPPSLLPDLASALGDATLLRNLPRTALDAGHSYDQQGRVAWVKPTVDGQSVIAEVRGSGNRPYRQNITLLARPDGSLNLQGRCSCPVGYNCKHVAAALIHLRRTLPAPRNPPSAPVLPHTLVHWLAQLETQAKPADAAGPRKRLFYLLDVPINPGGGNRLAVQCVTASLRKDGSIGEARPFRFQTSALQAGYLAPADLVILRRLESLKYRTEGLAADDDPPELLRRILASGRAHWGTPEGPPVTESEPRHGGIAWVVAEDGTQRPTLAAEPGLRGFLLDTPWQADPATGRVGPLITGLPPKLILALLAAPPVPAELVPRLAAELARRVPQAPPPVRLDPPEPIGGKPQPLLVLTQAVLPFDPQPRRNRRPQYGYAQTHTVPAARLAFRYGGRVTVGTQDSLPPRTLRQDGRLIRLTRDFSAEVAAMDRLREAGLIEADELAPAYSSYKSSGEWITGDPAEDPDWLDFMLHEVPALRAEGWQVETRDDFPLRLAEPDGDGDIAARLREGSGIDWFELELGVTVDGARVDLVPLLLRMIRRGQGKALAADHPDDMPFLVPLEDGRLLNLPMARIRPTLQALDELLAGGAASAEEARIGFTRLDAPGLAGFEETSGLAFQGGEALRALGRQLREAGGTLPKVAIPPDFQGALRPYQEQGVAWMQFLRRAGLGGVLADDMGLGKTVQTLAHLAIEHAEGRLDRPALIVCPTSVLPNWQREAARFAPMLRLLALHGPTRKDQFGKIPAQHLVLTTYPLLARDHEVLSAQEWSLAILDEAQVIRNPKAETTRQARRLKAAQRLCLSGTPLQNHLGDLWSLFDFLAPGFLGTEQGFRGRYRTPIEKQGDTARQAALNRRVRPFLLRRTKAEVVADLPPKTEILEPVAMEPAQRAIYEGIRLAMHTKVLAAIAQRGLARSGIIILDALLKLRQACCDPRLLKLTAVQAAKAGSAKLDRLMELLALLREEGRRVLVFSQFTSMLALIEERLRAEGIAYLTLTGSTRDRETPVRRFQSGEVPVFLISLKAGGVGLNLTAADTVIHYDPWWNPAAEDQATDRAHRIGQDRAVFVHRLVTLGSIEEKMEVLKDRKRALVDAVLAAEGGGALRLEAEDIEALFAAD